MSKPFDLSLMDHSEHRFLRKDDTSRDVTLINRGALHLQIQLPSINSLACASCVQRDPLPRLDIDAMGKLMDLSDDLLLMIIERMDIRSVFQLRATNLSLRCIVDNWQDFKVVLRYAETALKALIATRTSLLWTVPDLKSRIFTKTCELCNNHAEVLHLLKMMRVCFNCVTTDRRLLAVTAEFASQHIGLSEKELQALPRATIVPQGSFWGTIGQEKVYAVDYNAAIKLACGKVATKTKADVHREASGKHTPLYMKYENAQNVAYGPTIVKTTGSIYRRRQQTKERVMELPSTIVRAPENYNLQHACSVWFPAAEKLQSGRTRRIAAFYCAGYSLYWNFHSALPYQCHTLYEHDVDTAPEDSQGVAQTPFNRHISDCLYARYYWDKMYPPSFNHLDDANSELVENGGGRTREELRNAQNQLKTFLTSPQSSLLLHFWRHPHLAYSDYPERVREWKNNWRFKEIPHRLLFHALEMAVVQRKTGLELELERKLLSGDIAICEALSTQGDWKLPMDQKLQIEKVREMKTKAIEKDDGEEVDKYLDCLLGTSAGVSQSLWATARGGSSNSLFRGWFDLLVRRKYLAVLFRDRTDGSNYPIMNAHAWGMERFGNVSQL